MSVRQEEPTFCQEIYSIADTFEGLERENNICAILRHERGKNILTYPYVTGHGTTAHGCPKCLPNARS
jgi:hypothetical protein